MWDDLTSVIEELKREKKANNKLGTLLITVIAYNHIGHPYTQHALYQNCFDKVPPSLSTEWGKTVYQFSKIYMIC